MNKVLYPGSFDPITKGHTNIIEQASLLFDEVIIAIMHNEQKRTPLFTLTERMEIVKELYKNRKNIKVVTAVGATVDVALHYGCKGMVRGLRGVSDFDKELELASINRKLSNEQINTICLFSDEPFKYISSSMVKEIYKLGKDITAYVPKNVKKQMDKKLKYKKGVQNGKEYDRPTHT